jgi:hypothetical protein
MNSPRQAADVPKPVLQWFGTFRAVLETSLEQNPEFWGCFLLSIESRPII